MPSRKSPKNIATSGNQLNKLRAAVLGANDGIVSTAGLVLGVTGATATKETILLAGVAGLISGALSMAAGEFVSVSSQKDSKRSLLKRTQIHIKNEHDSEADELIEIYTAKGFSLETSTQAVKDLEKNNALVQELEAEIGIDPENIANPWATSLAFAASFTVGALIPLLAIALSPEHLRVPITAAAVTLSLALTGTISAHAGQANKLRAALRVVIWGIGAMIITYAIGNLIGVSLA